MGLTFEVDVPSILKAAPQATPFIALRLIDGIEKQELEEAIALSLGVPITAPQVEITRMNLVGSLRAVGYEVSGGRGGGKIYRVLGWKAPAVRKPASLWVGEAREKLDWFESLPKVTDADRTMIEGEFNWPSSQSLHEECWGFLKAYELARDDGRFVRGQDGLSILVRRFPDAPRFRIFNISMTFPELLELAMFIAPASTKRVKIIGVGDAIARLEPRGTLWRRRQAMYDLVDIASHPEKYFNERQMSYIRKHDREIVWGLSRKPRPEAEVEVIDQWRIVNEPKQRQLSITRDYVAAKELVGDLHCLGFRGERPVCLHILSPLAKAPDVAAQIVEKSLNYKTMPGGWPGTADFNLWKTAQILPQHGVKWINAGDFDGGTIGLAAHKERFAAQTIHSLTFETPYATVSETDRT